MVQRIFSSLLLVFFTLVSFQQLTLVSIYVLNQDYITETFCINKDKPEMQCKGKCHLMDTLEKVETEQNSTPVSVELQIQFPVFISEGSLFLATISSENFTFSPTSEAYASSYVASLFRPPPMV